MGATESIRVSLTQESDYVFRIAFDDTLAPDLLSDEPAPLGGGSGPNPGRLLVAAVANCLSASLLFALRKYRNTGGPLVTQAHADLERNEQGRLRVARVVAQIRLAGDAHDYAQIERILAQFEDFCVVTESVRHGIEVDVSVVDASGTLLHRGGAHA